MKTLIATLMSLVFLAAPINSYAESPAAAQNYENGMFSITRGPIVRLHMLNRAIPAGLTFTFQVLDRDRHVLSGSEREQVVGQGRALSFDFTTLGDQTDVHVLVNVRG